MKGHFKYNSKIYNSRQTSRQRRNKNRLLFLLIIFAIGIGGYFALPKIFKSNEEAKKADVTTVPEQKIMTNEEQIVKILPLPNIK
jgi:hypothetical protein